LALRHRGSPKTADYLTESEVRRVWDAGSFLIQQYGLTFNACLSLCWGLDGASAAKVTDIVWDCPALTDSNGMERHHELLAIVLAPVDPEWQVATHGNGAGPHWAKARTLLGIKRLRRAGSPIMRDRVSASRLISRGARQPAAEILPVLSIFDEGRWAEARTGWELLEHQYRQQLKLEWRHAMERFEIDWPPSESSMKERREAELDVFKRAWRDAGNVRIALRPGFGGLLQDLTSSRDDKKNSIV
jgi:hypothetical protein